MIKRDVSSTAGQPGKYLAEVKDVEVKRSRDKGHQMLVLYFIDPETGRDLCEDIAMLEGNGRGVGKSKLSMLGIDPALEEFDETEVIGRRVVLALYLDTSGGMERLKVDGKAAGSKLGYWPETEAASPPPPAVPPEAPYIAVDAPLPF